MRIALLIDEYLLSGAWIHTKKFHELAVALMELKFGDFGRVILQGLAWKFLKTLSTTTIMPSRGISFMRVSVTNLSITLNKCERSFAVDIFSAFWSKIGFFADLKVWAYDRVYLAYIAKVGLCFDGATSGKEERGVRSGTWG